MPQRIRQRGHTGTILYQGPIESTTGTWLGVDWDDSTRGKHDGSLKGNRYFSASRPTSGSFIRPNAPELELGSNFLTALKAKYIDGLVGGTESVLLGGSGGLIEVDATGLDKIRRKFSDLAKLKEVSLTDVSKAEDVDGAIAQTCPNVEGLDLSESLLASWDELSKITRELPRLQRLALNYTRLCLPTSTGADLGLSNLTTLTLVSALPAPHLSFSLVRKTILPSTPQLKLLEVGGNAWSSLQYHDEEGNIASYGGGTNLETINLASNAFTHLDDVLSSLSTFCLPSLIRVILADNPIMTLSSSAAREPLQIKHLSLAGTALSPTTTHRVLAAYLNLRLPTLESLYLAGTPLAGDGNVRPQTIARLPHLKSLDGGEVTARERTDAERWWISWIQKQRENVQSHAGDSTEGDDSGKAEEERRWKQLSLEHLGTIETQTQQTPNTRARENMGSRLINIMVIHSTTSPSDTCKAIDGSNESVETTLKILPSTPLKTLRLKAARSLASTLSAQQGKTVKPSGGVKLWLEMPDGVVELPSKSSTEDSKDVGWFGIEPGSRIWLTYADD